MTSVRHEEPVFSSKPRVRHNKRKVTVKQARAYLDGLRAGLTHKAAAELAGTNYSAMNGARFGDEVFQRAVAEAWDEGVQVYEQRLYDLALAVVPAKSMAAVTAVFGVLRARRPEVYRDSYVAKEQNAGTGRPDFSHLTDTELEAACDALAKAVSRRAPDELLRG